MSSTNGFELNYTAAGGRPYVQTALHISPTGQAELYLGSSWSLPPGDLDTVGFFGGEVPAETWHNLQAYLTAENMLAHQGTGPATSPDMASRHLTLRQGGQQQTITIADTSQVPALARLEGLLIAIMTDLTIKPVRAAQVTLDLSANGRAREPQMTITNVGTQPLFLLLFAAAEVNQYMRIEFNIEQRFTLPSGIEMWPPVSSISPLRADIMALTEAGTIPEGVHALAPGTAHSFRLPEIIMPESSQPLYLRGMVTFWLSDNEADLRPVTIQTRRIVLNESSSY